MALKFKCEKCNAEIVTKYLKPGEEVQCKACGLAFAVPKSVVEVGDHESHIAKDSPLHQLEVDNIDQSQAFREELKKYQFVA